MLSTTPKISEISLQLSDFDYERYRIFPSLSVTGRQNIASAIKVMKGRKLIVEIEADDNWSWLYW